MFYRDHNELPVGVLCDWDLAEARLPDEAYERDDARILAIPRGNTGTGSRDLQSADATVEDDPHRPRYRTGTGPFIALEILQEKKPPLHRYRYELESFFYLLAYFCAVFNPEEHSFHRLSAWEHHDLGVIGKAKADFLADHDYLSLFKPHGHADYQPLIEDWVVPLRQLFAEAYLERQNIAFRIAQLHANRISGARVRRQKMQPENEDELESRKQKWRTFITYDDFMDCLGEPAHLPADPECPECSDSLA